jgi:hypothetical protein
MPPRDDALKVNPLIAKLAGATSGGAVELQGYVGPSEAGTVRLYRSLAMDSYVDIPREAILDAADVESDSEGRVRLYVQGTSELKEVSISSVRAPSSLAASRSRGLDLSFARAVAAQGKGNSFDATCDAVEDLIEDYEAVLEGESIFGSAVDTVPGARDFVQGKLKDAREFKARVCDPVRNA